MPSTCDTNTDSSNSNVNNNKNENGTSSQPQTNMNGKKSSSGGFIDEDVDYEMPVVLKKTSSINGSDQPTSTSKSKSDSTTNDDAETNDDFIFIQDTGFNIKIAAPGMEPFDLQVSPLELVQEINHQLIDREDTCHRTCFSLQLDGNTLDNFCELKNIDGLKEGSVIKVVEEPYTVREARIHVRHVRDLLKSLDMSDAYNGVDCSSLSFMNVIAQNDFFDQKSKSSKSSSSPSFRSDQLDCLPPEFVIPFESSNLNSSTSINNNNNNNSTVNGSTSPSLNGSTSPQSNGSSTSSSSVTVSTSTNNGTNNNANTITREPQLLPLIPVSKDQPKSPSALKVLTASGWNPPPGSRKLRGDLMYLYVVTLEEKRVHITSSTRGFYVNLSTDEQFNPKPANPKQIFHSLVELLSHTSPAFKRNYSLIQKRRHQRHPFERLVTPYQMYTWAALQIDHTVDSIRAEDAFSSKLGYEEHMPGQTRDWNEELQTTRELARKTLAERIIRERAIFKVHSDFVAAATRGAMAVIDGNVMALNPGEDTKMQMFIWNNIFFSLGFDVRDHYKELGGDAAAFAAPCNDLHGVRAYSSIDIEGLYTLATAVIDYKGYRVTAQSIIPGILERDQEQSVVYGSIDFGKTVVNNPKYLELLNKAGQMLKIIPHKVISQDGKVVEICSSVECKGIIGNDGRHYILDLLRTFPSDPNFIVIDGEELSSEMQALGFPRRHKHNLCSLRQELVDAFFEARYILFIKLAAFYLQQSDLKKGKISTSESKATIENAEQVETNELKEDETEKTVKEGNYGKTTIENDGDVNVSEDYKKLIESMTSQEKQQETIVDEEPANESSSGHLSKQSQDTREIIKKAASDVGSISENDFDLRFNPDIFSLGVTHADADSESFKKQKQLIKDAAEFLVKIQIPSLVREALEHSTYLYDGLTLTEAMHSRGINIRYLGKLADLVSKHEVLDYLMNIVVTELICRSAKHLFTSYVQSVEVVYLSIAVSHFLNCFLSQTVSLPATLFQNENSKRRGKKNKNGGNGNSKSNGIIDQRQNLDWISLTPKSLWNSIRSEMDSYFGWSNGKDIDSIETMLAKYSIQKISLLRLFSIRTGIQILLREYNFEHKNRPAFNEDDILNVFPIVKHISPRATDAYNFFQTGQRKIQEGSLREGYDYITEALNLFNNVYGPLHSDIVQCLRLLGRINYVLCDYQEACSFQQKAVLMSEKVNGIDHPHTINEYNFLALYSFANSQITTSLKFLYRARYLLSLIHGQNHPEMSIIDSNIGLILHAIGEYDNSLRFLEHALKLNLRFFGPRHLKVALSYHLVARTLSCMGDFRCALNNEKETYMIYKKELGETHDKTKESSECLRHLTNQAVVLQKKMNEIYKGNVNAIIPPIQIQPPSISSVLEMLNLINGILFVHLSAQDMENLKELQSNKSKSTGNATKEPAEEVDCIDSKSSDTNDSLKSTNENVIAATTATASA